MDKTLYEDYVLYTVVGNYFEMYFIYVCICTKQHINNLTAEYWNRGTALLLISTYYFVNDYQYFWKLKTIPYTQAPRKFTVPLCLFQQIKPWVYLDIYSIQKWHGHNFYSGLFGRGKKLNFCWGFVLMISSKLWIQWTILPFGLN